MDRIRAALGERKASYLGYSYGSYLGAVYTSLFPQRSDRVILDSSVNPNNIWYDTWRGFGYAVALRLPDFTTWASKRNDVFGLGSTPAAVENYFFSQAAKLDQEPIELPEILPGLLITGNVFREITRSLLYDDRLFALLALIWQAVGLPAGVAPSASPNPGSLNLQVPVDNQVAVLYSIVCNDIAWSRDLGMYERNTRIERRLFPATAGMPANVWPCVFWANSPVEPPVRIEDNGPRNILILQNLRDPATPWAGAVGMRLAFAHRSTMVTIDAGGHGVYGIRSGPCTDAIATAFLVSGVLPAHDRFCEGPSPEDQATAFAGAQRSPLPGPL
jgi:pimeloyl-ACP methyl ester carboxylesterase